MHMRRLDPRPQTLAPRRRQRRRAGGFTLIEASLTTVIVGTGVLAIVAAQQAYHMKNNWAGRTTTGMLLANEIRELTLNLPLHDPITGEANYGPELDESSVVAYDDLDDFAGTVSAGVGTGTTFNPPINALKLEIPDLDRWSQVVTVENVLPDYIDAAFSQPMGSTNVMRVNVAVLYTDSSGAQETITELTWVVAEE